MNSVQMSCRLHCHGRQSSMNVQEASIRPLHHVVKQLLQKVHEATLYERLQQQLLNASAMLLHVLVNKAPCAVPVEVQC